MKIYIIHFYKIENNKFSTKDILIKHLKLLFIIFYINPYLKLYSFKY